MGQAMEILGREFQSLRDADNLGESVSAWLRHRFPRDTAKMTALYAGLDVKTAQNAVTSRIVSATTLTKLIRAFGWPFLMEVGAALLRETYDEAITKEIKEIADAQQRLQDLGDAVRNRREGLRARRALGAGGLVLVPPNGGATDRRDGPEGRGLGLGPDQR